MASIEKRNGKYRVRFRDPIGRPRSKTFVRKADADRRLSRLNAEEIEQWLGTELARGISPSSVHRHYRTLRRVLQAAVEKDRLLANPCAKVRRPGSRPVRWRS